MFQMVYVTKLGLCCQFYLMGDLNTSKSRIGCHLNGVLYNHLMLPMIRVLLHNHHLHYLNCLHDDDDDDDDDDDYDN